MTRPLIAAVLCMTCIFGIATSVAAQDSAGKFWVNIKQTGPLQYAIVLEITAATELEIRAVKVPGILDASELPGKMALKPLEKDIFEIPIAFIDSGEGLLWVGIYGGEDQQQFLVFQLFNGARGSASLQQLSSALSAWSTAGATNSIIQLSGKAPVACDENMPSQLRSHEAFGQRAALTGVILVGSTRELDGQVDTVDLKEGWTLDYIRTRASRVASFQKTGDLPPMEEQPEEQRAETDTQRDNPPDNSADSKPAKAEAAEKETQQPQSTSETQSTTDSNNARQQRPDASESTRNQPDTTEGKPTGDNRSETTSRPVTKPEPEPEPEPPSGPFNGSGPSSAIPGVTPKTDWSGDNPYAGGNAGANARGPFGETTVRLPEELQQLSNINTITLVVTLRSEGGPGMGRISFSDSPMLSSAGSGAWYGTHVQQQGDLLGDFDTRSNQQLRFDVTSKVKDSPIQTWYVLILNLSRATVSVVDAHFEVDGIW